MIRKSIYKLSRAALATLLALAMVVGFGAMFAPEVAAEYSFDDSEQIIPEVVQDPEKPHITIETNLVVDATGKPTGYVEVALKVTTPTLYYADAKMNYLRYEGDYTIDATTKVGSHDSNITDPDHIAALDLLKNVFDPDDHSTYVTTRQTTFRSGGVTLEYNSDVLLPVSWEHSVEDGDSTVYPDFFFDTYGYEYVDITDNTTDPANPVTTQEIIKTTERVAADKEAAANNAANPSAEPVDPDYSSRILENGPEDVLADFNSRLNYSVAVPVLQDSTEISSARAFVQGETDGRSLLAIEVNTSVDMAFPEETTLAVVRFLYTGTKDIANAIEMKGEELVVKTTEFISAHDVVAGGTNPPESLFNFPADTALENSPVGQILFYSAGYYVGYRRTDTDAGEGDNEFYSTKIPYNENDADTYEKIYHYIDEDGNPTPYDEHLTVFRPRPKTGTSDIVDNTVNFDEDRAVVLAKTTDGADETVADDYSYVSNLLYTSSSQEFDEGTNVRFTMAAKESYNAGGGTDIDNVATIVFLDWDDSILGALSVVKGDARKAVEEYVENFIHPTLRASKYKGLTDTTAQDMLKNLATSLERQYTYAGKYPNVYGATEAVGTNTFPDGYEDENGNDLSGSAYPLTNKLDYAFLRRPVTKKVVIDADVKQLYQDDDGNYVDAIEWTTDIIDYDGTRTPTDINDDYFYIHGWAVVEARDREDETINNPIEPDSVWTTFSGAGELSEVRFPGYDTNTNYDGLNSYRANVIAPAGADDTTGIAFTGDSNAKAWGGTTSKDIPTSGAQGDPISFATYAASDYFEFADFAKIEVDELYVKACYEPSEELNWTDNYIVVGKPYYVRNDVLASTEAGNSYAVSFNYERINSSGYGVLRTRDPYARVEFIVDASTAEEQFQEGNTAYEELPLENTDEVTMKFAFNSGFHSATYTLVEVYGSESVALSIDRSSDGNEAEVLSNYSYLKDDQDGNIGESSDNGYIYENRLGSKGYVYTATLRQILEQGTATIKTIKQLEAGTNPDKDKLIPQAKSDFINSYVTQATFLDLNLRLDEDGMEASETGFLEDLAREDAQNAIYDAIEIAYNKGVFDDTGVVDLEWHQLQYHILHYGIDDGIEISSGVLAPGACGSYEWCRQDNCSAEVSIPMKTLEDALDAVDMYYNSSSANTKAAAKKALQNHLISILTGNRILDEDKIVLAAEADTLEEVKAYPYENWETLAQKLNTLNGSMGGTTATATQVQHWLDATDSSEPTGDTRYTYWWHYWDVKPYAIDFTPTDADVDDVEELIDKLIEATVSFGEGNPQAWDNLTADVIEQMRFRSTARGDFFDSDTTQPAGYTTSYMPSIYDSRTELVLEPYTDVDAFVAAVTELLTAYGYDETDGWKTQGDIDTALGKYAWYRIQCYLLTGADTAYPEVYAGMSVGTDNAFSEHTAGTYWWRDINRNDMRLAGNPDAATEGYAYIGATLGDIQKMLDNYATAIKLNVETLKEQYEAEFLIWFTPEVAADLILKKDRIGTAIDELSAGTIAESLLKLVRDEPAVDFSEITWSELQYYIVNGSYASRKVAQGEYTYNGKCSWAYVDGDVSKSNRWRDPVLPSITDLKQFLLALEAYADSKNGVNLDSDAQANADLFKNAIDSKSDLENLDFKVGTAFADLTGDALRDALVQMRSAYITGLGDADTVNSTVWYTLANSTRSANATFFTPRDQWYLVQYYLDKGVFASATADETIHTATIAAAREYYWWEYGWSSASLMSNSLTVSNALYYSVYSNVPARVYYLTNTGQHSNGVDYGASNTTADMESRFSDYTQNLIGGDRKSLGWNSEAFRRALIEAGKKGFTSYTAWWEYVQFLALHYDQNENANYTDMAGSTAESEADAFYWWVGDGSATELTIASDADIDSMAETVMQAALLKAATGTTESDELFTDAVIANMRLRIPDEDAVAIGGMDTYTDDPTTPENEIYEELEDFVEVAYDELTKADASWDYRTDADTHWIYTYSSTAWSEVTGFTAAQLQYWFDKQAYVSDEVASAEGYWWLEKDTNASEEAVKDSLIAFIETTITYAYRLKNDAANAVAIATEWYNYVASVPYPELELDYSGISGANATQATNYSRAALTLVYRAVDGGTYTADFSWRQMQVLLKNRQTVTAANALKTYPGYTPPELLVEELDGDGNIVGGLVSVTLP